MKNILIAEDSSVIQNLTKKILSFQGFNVSSAKNGKEVLDMLETSDFDVILMDINMPVMDGMDCTKAIRKLNSDKSKISVIAITGNARNYTEEEFTEAGIDAFLQKPLNFDLLVETVKKFTA